MGVHLFAGIAVGDYATALAWYERLLGSPPSFFPHDTEAVWELAEHRSLYIVQRPEHAGHAVHTLIVDDLDAGWPDSSAGAGARPAGDVRQRRAQAHLRRPRRERDRVRRGPRLTGGRRLRPDLAARRSGTPMRPVRSRPVAARNIQHVGGATGRGLSGAAGGPGQPHRGGEGEWGGKIVQGGWWGVRERG